MLAELTYRCPLACAYCSNPLNMADYQDELTTDEWRRVLPLPRASVREDPLERIWAESP